MASVTMGFDQFGAFLARKAEEVARLDYRPVLREISLLAKSDVLQNFAAQRSPDGVPWAPLKPGSRNRPRDRKAKKRGFKPMILVDHGILRASISAGPQHVETITPTSLEMGTAISYGRFHQEGTRRMVARPFLGWSPRLTTQAAEAVSGFLAERLGAL